MKKILLTGAVLLSTHLAYAGGDIIPNETTATFQTPPTIEADNGYHVTLKAGTLGVGLDISHLFNDSFALRANINGLKYNDKREVADIDYDADLKLFTAGLLGDYYPFENNFRVSAGIYYNDNHADGVFIPTKGQTFEFGGHTYTVNQIGKIDSGASYDDTVAPYIGIGWGSKNKSSGWGFTLDVGGLYQGSTKIYTDPTINPNLPASVRKQIENDIEVERKRIEDDIKDYQWYPVIMLGITYSF